MFLILVQAKLLSLIQVVEEEMDGLFYSTVLVEMANNERVKNIIKEINKEKALKYASKNDINGENFLKMVLDGDTRYKNDYINSIYDKFLYESKEFNYVKNSEGNYEIEQNLSTMQTQYKAHHKIMSPTLSNISQNEYSLNKLKESFNNMTDTLRSIKNQTKIRPK